MPLLPVHLGPGVVLKAAAPNRCSFAAFALSQLVIDAESVINHLRAAWPVHRMLHTLLGATLAGLAAGALAITALGWVAAGRWRPPLGPALVGGTLGGAVHVLFDSLVHADVRPLWPFAEGNPLLGCLSPGAVDAAGLVLGALGALWLWARRSQRAPA